jgi:two-component system, LytTR family, response regulator
VPAPPRIRVARRRSRGDSAHSQSAREARIARARGDVRDASCARNEDSQPMRRRRRNAPSRRPVSFNGISRIGGLASVANNGTGGLRVLVADGEEEARKRLRALLHSVEIIAAIEEAHTAPQATRFVEAFRPDLVLLDLDLPDAAGIAPLRAPGGPCLVAMTAYPEVALPACELEIQGCLVKPVQRERLAGALQRVRRRLAERRIAELALEIAGTAASIRGPAQPTGAHYPDQMTIRVRRRMFALPVADISWIEGASQYSRVHARAGEYLLSRSLSSLECELDPGRFFRIHRSAIVNADYVREVMSRGDGRYNVYLEGGEALPLGRARRETLDRLLGGMERKKKNGGPKAAVSG